MSPSGNPLSSNVSREAPREASRRGERRRCGRIPLGLPVRVHFAGRVLAVTVELVNAGRGGCYLRGVTARVGAKVAFGFALPGGGICLVRGRVARAEPQAFAIMISATNETFDALLEGLSGGVAVQAA